MRKDFNYLYHVNAEKRYELYVQFYIFYEKISM